MIFYLDDSSISRKLNSSLSLVKFSYRFLFYFSKFFKINKKKFIFAKLYTIISFLRLSLSSNNYENFLK